MTTSSPTFNNLTVQNDLSVTNTCSAQKLEISDYGYALGGMHVGGISDPGTNNLLVDGMATFWNGFETGESASGGGIRFGKKYSVSGNINPIVTCRSGYFWWDFTVRQLKFTETDAAHDVARFSGIKNEGSGPVLFDGTVSEDWTSIIATLNGDEEYASVELTSGHSGGGYIHLYCLFSSNAFIAHYWYRFN